MEVSSDYTPGYCSEGGTGVVIALVDGKTTRIDTLNKHVTLCLSIIDCVTVKYIYGPASVGAAQDSVIGSSISGRLETGIGLKRLTTICMPMKGNMFHFLRLLPATVTKNLLPPKALYQNERLGNSQMQVNKQAVMMFNPKKKTYLKDRTLLERLKQGFTRYATTKKAGLKTTL